MEKEVEVNLDLKESMLMQPITIISYSLIIKIRMPLNIIESFNSQIEIRIINQAELVDYSKFIKS